MPFTAAFGPPTQKEAVTAIMSSNTMDRAQYLQEIYRTIDTNSIFSKRLKTKLKTSQIYKKEGGRGAVNTGENVINLATILNAMDDVNTELKSVDFSGQGLTVVPNTLFKRRDIGYLNLSSNNIRSLPVDIHLLGMLRKLDLSSNGLRCSHPNDTNTLPREMEQLIFLEELSLAECNLIFIPATVWQLTSLLRLDISRNRLGKLPPEVGNLFNLRFLNAQQAGLRTLPPEIVCCELLEVLLLFGNAVDALPDTMRELSNLHTLSINTRGFAAVIDDYMDNMLMKGQIQSEHIAPVLFDIPHLKSLELENCKINHLPETISEGIQNLSIASNYFTSLPNSVCQLINLHSLDISYNSLSTLPPALSNLTGLRRFLAHHNQLSIFLPELKEMKTLEHLDLGYNAIEELPEDIYSLRDLRILVLSENKLFRVPDGLCEMESLETLDLTGNKLSVLPTQMYRLTNIRTAHTYEGLFRIGLWLHRNPLKVPPPNVWKSKDPNKIWSFLRSAEIRSIENLQILKVVTLGDHGSGKSALLRSLVAGRSTDEVQPTAAYDLSSWTSSDTVRFFFVDLGTHSVYHALLPTFLESKALLLLTIDLETAAKDGFEAVAGPWLERVLFFAPGAAVLLVGTKLDRYLAEDDDDEEENEEGSSRDEGQTDSGRAEKNGADSGRAEKNGADSGRAEKNGADSGRAEKNAEDGGRAEKNGADSGRAEKNGADSGRAEKNGADSGRSEKNAEDGGRAEDQGEEREEEGCEADEEECQRLAQSLWKEASQFVANLEVRQEEDRPILYGGRVFLTSARSEAMVGISQVSAMLETAAIDDAVFPHNRRYVLPTWRHVSNLIKQMEGPYLMLSDVKEACKNAYGLRGQAIDDCLEYLHDNGKIMHFSRLPVLSDYIFHRPHRLQRLLSCICRVDLENFLDYSSNRIFKCRGHLSEEEFSTAREMALRFGELSQPIVDCMLFELQSGGRESIATLSEVAELFGLGYGVALPEIPLGKIFDQPVLVLPQGNCTPAPQDFLTSLPPRTAWQRAATAVFPRRVPLGIWPFLLTQLHSRVDSRVDWSGLVYTQQDSVHLVLSRTEDGGEAKLRMEAWAEADEVADDPVAWFVSNLDSIRRVWPCIPMTVVNEG